MVRLSARSVHLLDQVMAVLDEAAPLPVSTNEVLAGAALGETDRARVLTLLNRASRLGDVEKIVISSQYCRYWRSWPEPGQDAQ